MSKEKPKNAEQLSEEQKLQLDARKLQDEARRLMDEKVKRVCAEIDAILSREGFMLRVDHQINLVPKQQ